MKNGSGEERRNNRYQELGGNTALWGGLGSEKVLGYFVNVQLNIYVREQLKAGRWRVLLIAGGQLGKLEAEWNLSVV